METWQKHDVNMTRMHVEDGTFDNLSCAGVIHLDLLRVGSEDLVKHVWLPLKTTAQLQFKNVN